MNDCCEKLKEELRNKVELELTLMSIRDKYKEQFMKSVFGDGR